MTSNTASVLYVVNDFDYFRAHRQSLALAVSEQGHDVYVLTGECSDEDLRSAPPQLHVVPVALDRHGLSPVTDVTFMKKLSDLVAKIRPEIVHLITMKPVLMGSIALALRSYRGRVVWTLPGLGKIFEQPSSAYRRLRRSTVTKALTWAQRRLDALVTVENEGDLQILSRRRIAPRQKISVIDGTGLDLEHFRPQPGTKSDNRPFTFLMATRLINAKGVDTFLAVARKIGDRTENVRFELAGKFDRTNPDGVSEQAIEQADEQGAIVFKGAVSMEDMPALLSSADVLVLPTRLREGFPRSLMEAAACGCALIATDQPPMRRLVIPEKTGWLLAQPDETALLEACEAALGDPSVAREMGKAAAHHVRSLPVDEKSVNQQFFAVYGWEGSSHDR